MKKPWPGQQNYLDAFIKTAQYLASLTAQQDVWSEVGKVLVNFFGADLVAFGERRADGEITGRHWAFSGQDFGEPSDSAQDRLSRAVSSQRNLGSETREAIVEVLESGFLAWRLIPTPEPLSLAFLPITQENQVTAVMLVGHRMSKPLPKELLNVYLAVAGLVGTIATRLASEIELRQHRQHLEESVKERTAELRRTNEQLEQEITERKQMQGEIEQRRRYLEGVLRAAPDAICTMDAHHRIVEWNTGAEKLFGYSREEAVGQYLDDLVTAPDVLEEAAGFTQMVTDRKDLPPIEAIRYRKDGSPVDVIVAASPILVEGEFTGLVGVYTDITERKQAEEQLQRYAVELEQANEEIKQFAYIVSHDLRGPLVNLKGFAAELRSALQVIDSAMDTALPHLGEEQRRTLTFALDEDVPEALQFIDSSVTRMDDFINAVLRLSRLGRRELRLEPVDMDDLVQATLETLAHQVEEHQGKVTVGTLLEVVVDRTSMEQIMGNLLGNAVKYLAPDRPAEIEITAERGPDETTFRIRDNGRGIAEEDMDKVFAPFRRIGRQDVPGEGMGLPYVQILVRRHGGRIWCESELGVGTTFSFTIAAPPGGQ